MVSTFPLQFGIPGGPELLIILLIAVLLFGANKIPQLARSTGEAMGEFQKGREEVEQELQEMRDGTTPTPDTPSDAEPEVETETETQSGLDEADGIEADDEVDDTEGDESEFEIDDAKADERTT